MPEEKPEAPADQKDDEGEEEVRPQTAIMGVPDFGDDDDDDDGPPAADADTQQVARPDVRQVHPRKAL